MSVVERREGERGEKGKHQNCKKDGAGCELSMGELQDPFLVSVHLIADPGEGKFLQRAADAVLAWVHPELQLFRVSERASVSQRSRSKRHQNGSPASACQPALAVILFLQEAYGGDEHILMLHRALQRPPWHYHHTEKVSNGRRMLPLTPCSQDFFTLSPGTPLWAVRQVHYGKEIVRFTVYCRHENYVDMVRLYKLLLQRRVAQKKDDFCFFVVYSNPDMEIQLSFKRLPRGHSPMVLDSAVMEVRVRDVGVLVPLLPHPCSPISEVRWQTEDYDGNKILLQVRSRYPAPPAVSPHQHCGILSSQKTGLMLSCINSRQRCRLSPKHQEQWPDQHHLDSWRSQWRGHRSGSLFSLPNLGSASSRSACSSPGPCPSPHYRSHSLHRSSSLIPPFRLNVDALIGAEETDVDTGNKVNPGSSVDLTVVSAYVKSSLPQTPRPLSAPPEDIGPRLSPVTPEGGYKSATLENTGPPAQDHDTNPAVSTAAGHLLFKPETAFKKGP
uniref:Family with sequence similarity 124 member A n=1 Tax=Amphilophus citrinellus TaxID=61819 RepID=A0A3Q0SZ99_AMPCI